METGGWGVVVGSPRHDEQTPRARLCHRGNRDQRIIAISRISQNNMKKFILVSGAAFGFALLVAGCSTGPSARIQEKSSVYATLKTWEKKHIDQGVIANGFTPDMVYMAVGNPSKVKSQGNEELWTYNNYYPPMDAAHMGYAGYRTDSPYQPSRQTNPNSPNNLAPDYDGEDYNISFSTSKTGTPVGTDRTPQSIATTGGPQGSTIEPADLESYTLLVLFVDGKVSRIGIRQT
jgi:hypothetical protein